MPWLIRRLGLDRAVAGKEEVAAPEARPLVAPGELPSRTAANPRIPLLLAGPAGRDDRARWRWSSSSAGRSTTSPGDTMGAEGSRAPARAHRPRPVRAAVPADAGHRLDRRPGRPALDRPRLGRARARLRACRSPGLAWTHTTTLAAAVRRRRLARRRPRLRRPGAWRARAEPRPARDPAPRHRLVLDRLAESGRSSARRSAAISTPARRTRPMRPARCCSPSSLVGLFTDPARSRGPRSTRGPNPWAQMVDGLRYVRHNRLVLGAHHPRPVRGAARRRDGDAAGLRPRHPPRRARRASAICARAPAVGATLTALFFSVRPLEAQRRRQDAAARSACSARRRSSSACRARCRCRSPASRCSARPTCSRSMSASR